MNVNEVAAEAVALYQRITDGIAAKQIIWSKMDVPHPGGRAFTGAGNGSVAGVRVVVVEFDISDQGFPEGSKGYDGTATFNGLVARLPRNLSEEFFKAALEQSVA